MERENGERGASSATASADRERASDKGSAAAAESTNLLDAASLFAYWPRPDAGSGSTANALFGGYGSGSHPYSSLVGSRGGSYPPPPVPSTTSSYASLGTLSVAASQAASLGINPASAAWWTMASHLAAQDYLARLQATTAGLSGFAGLSADGLLPSYQGLLGHHAQGQHVGGSKSSKSSSNSNNNTNNSCAPPNAATSALHHAIAAGAGAHRDQPPALLSDPSASILGGVRLPPDTEIIKYTSSIIGPKVPGTTNRGRKKTISLDPPSVSVLPSLDHPNRHSSKKEGSSYSRKANRKDVSAADDTSHYYRYAMEAAASTGGTVTNGRAATPLAQYQQQDADAPLNLSLKPASSSPSTNHNALQSLSTLSQSLGHMPADRISRRKPGPKPRRVTPSPSSALPTAPSANPSPSLSQLFAAADSPRPSSGSEENDSSTHHKDGRPRNLGRGVSKPKKNTVASLLAQSRALGLKPGLDLASPLNHQVTLLKANIQHHRDKVERERDGEERGRSSSPLSTADESDKGKRQQAQAMANYRSLEELKALVGDALSDSNSPDVSSDSNTETNSDMSDSETQDKRKLPPDLPQESSRSRKRRKLVECDGLRVPLEQGWRRETLIQGLNRNGLLRGDVTYYSPCGRRFKQYPDLLRYLEKHNMTELGRDHFSFSCRAIVGDFLQPGQGTDEPTRLTEQEVNRRLDEIKQLNSHRPDAEQQLATKLEREKQAMAAKEAKRAAKEEAARQREHLRLLKEQERSERQEALRKEREQRNQQLMEGRKRLAFTWEQKWEIIREIEAGKSKSDVSRSLGLATSTVATIWKNRTSVPAVRPQAPPATPSPSPARRKRQEETEKHRQDEQQRKQQEREMKRQQAVLLKEQLYMQELNKQREMLYTVELERERRRQHMALVKSLEARKRTEERERRRQEARAEKMAWRERRMEQRRVEVELLRELRKPVEDMSISDLKPLPTLDRIPGLKLAGQAFADTLMVFEFLHNFGETLGFDMGSLPSMNSLQSALLGEETGSEEELLSVMTHLIICAIEDPGIPNPARHTTLLGQSLKQADITHVNLSEILRVYLYANATGEVKSLTGQHFEREREKRSSEHHNNLSEPSGGGSGGGEAGSLEPAAESSSKNAAFFSALHENATWRMSEWLRRRPFLALSPTQKAAVLAFLCHELLQNKAVIRQIDGAMEAVAQLRRDRWNTDAKIRKLRHLQSRKMRQVGLVVMGGMQGMKGIGETDEEGKVDGEEEEEVEGESGNESEGTQPEEEEDKKLSVEELGRKIERMNRSAETTAAAFSTSQGKLRSPCFGQDRYHRRYWALPSVGGVIVEGMESAANHLYSTLQKGGNISYEDIHEKPEPKMEDEGTNTDFELAELALELKCGSQDLNKDEEMSASQEIKEDGLEEEKVMVKHELLDSHMEVEMEANQLSEELKEEMRIKMEFRNRIKGEEFETKEEKMEVDDDGKEGDVEGEDTGSVEGEREMEEKNGLAAVVIDEKLPQLKCSESGQLDTLSEKESSGSCGVGSSWAQQSDNMAAWFSLLPKEPCDSSSIVIAQPRSEPGSELRIPVFPPPPLSPSLSDSPSPAPLQITPEESAMLEHVKLHGLPPRSKPDTVPSEVRRGWWRITEPEKLQAIVSSLHPRGVRERELKRTIMRPCLEQSWHDTLKNCVRSGTSSIELNTSEEDRRICVEDGAPAEDKPDDWSRGVALRVDMAVLEQVEAMEEKVANASMQVKGWKVPTRASTEQGLEFHPACSPGDSTLNPVLLAKDRLISLEAAIERRYLKPPLGFSSGDVNLAGGGAGGCEQGESIPKGLLVWREAVAKSQTSAQLSMALYMLEASIAWDKSIMKANCQFCHSGDNEDKLLLCDGCDKGYHTYCFRPKMDNIPEGDWYCHECMNKATGERNCIVCGKRIGRNLMLCEHCPRAYHTDCLVPPLPKMPRGKWHCPTCQSKLPKKRGPTRRSTSATNLNNSASPNSANKILDDSNASSNQESIMSPAAAEDSPCPESPPPSTTPAASPIVTVTAPVTTPAKKDKGGCGGAGPGRKLAKELAPCRQLLEDLEAQDDAWPFLLPVNTKQFPTYKKIISSPMDLSTIKARLLQSGYKSREEFCSDVRLIFNNCETFNEDDSPVGKAGHGMRQFFETRWNELTNQKPPSS